MDGLKLPALPVAVAVLGVLGVGLVALYVWRKGSVSQAAAGAGALAVQAAGGVVSGAVGQAGAAVGLPTPDETVTDPAQVRYLIDRLGYFEASKWAGLPALIAAARMDAGSGVAPPAGSPAGRMLALLPAQVPGEVLADRPAMWSAPSFEAGLGDPYAPFIGSPFTGSP